MPTPVPPTPMDACPPSTAEELVAKELIVRSIERYGFMGPIDDALVPVRMLVLSSKQDRISRGKQDIDRTKSRRHVHVFGARPAKAEEEMDGGAAAAGTGFVSMSFFPCVATLHAFSRSFPSSSSAFSRVKVVR